MEKLDTRGLRYTMPLVRLAAAMKGAEPGQEFEITSDYPAFEQDIKKWCATTGNNLRNVTRTGSDITAVVAKKAA